MSSWVLSSILRELRTPVQYPLAQELESALKQQPHHHLRIVGRLPSGIFVIGEDLLQVQMFGQIGDEPRQVIFLEPVLEGDRHQEGFIEVAGAKPLAHRKMIAELKSFHYTNVWSNRSLLSTVGGQIYFRHTPSPWFWLDGEIAHAWSRFTV